MDELNQPYELLPAVTILRRHANDSGDGVWGEIDVAETVDRALELAIQHPAIVVAESLLAALSAENDESLIDEIAAAFRGDGEAGAQELDPRSSGAKLRLALQSVDEQQRRYVGGFDVGSMQTMIFEHETMKARVAKLDESLFALSLVCRFAVSALGKKPHGELLDALMKARSFLDGEGMKWLVEQR